MRIILPLKNVVACAITFSSLTLAQAYSPPASTFQSTKFNLFQEIYSGDDYKSLSQGRPGYGFEFSRDAGGSYFRSYMKGRFGNSAGRQKFKDGNSPVDADYSYNFAQGELGVLFYPISRADKGINLFIGAGGMMGLSSLALESTNSTSFTQLKAQQQAMSFGYMACLGIEMIFSSSAQQHYMAVLEAAYRQQHAGLAGQSSFDLGGLSISLGIGW